MILPLIVNNKNPPVSIPVAYSTVSEAALGGLLISRYGLTAVKCAFLLRGVGDTYTVSTSSQRFVLRIYRHDQRSYDQIREEVELLLSLNAAGVSVSYPLPDVNRNFITAIAAPEGIRHAVLFSFAQGKFSPVLTENQLRVLGREMARFHLLSPVTPAKKSRWSFDTNTTLLKPLDAIKDYSAVYPEGYDWLCTMAQKTARALSALDTAGFTSGYCHFDFFPKNFHFDEEDRITIFDFDFCGYGWRINDLMTFRTSLWFDVHTGRLQETDADKSFRIFLSSYNEINLVTEEERKAIVLLMPGFWMFYFGFYTTHDQFFPLLHETHLRARIDMIRKFFEKYVAPHLPAD